MRRKFSFAPDEYYHLYSRGVEKRNIFLNKRDYTRFTHLLFLSNGLESYEVRTLGKIKPFDFDRGNNLVYIGAWSLMPNHIHLLVKEKQEGGISKMMKKLLTGYSMYFNIKYKRTGVLFQGRFGAKHIDSDEYLRRIFSYIHANPLERFDLSLSEQNQNRNMCLNKLKNYDFSSLKDYMGSSRLESKIICPSKFPDYYESEDDLLEDIIDWQNIAQQKAQ